MLRARASFVIHGVLACVLAGACADEAIVLSREPTESGGTNFADSSSAADAPDSSIFVWPLPFDVSFPWPSLEDRLAHAIADAATEEGGVVGFRFFGCDSQLETVLCSGTGHEACESDMGLPNDGGLRVIDCLQGVLTNTGITSRPHSGPPFVPGDVCGKPGADCCVELWPCSDARGPGNATRVCGGPCSAPRVGEPVTACLDAGALDEGTREPGFIDAGGPMFMPFARGQPCLGHMLCDAYGFALSEQSPRRFLYFCAGGAMQLGVLGRDGL